MRSTRRRRAAAPRLAATRPAARRVRYHADLPGAARALRTARHTAQPLPPGPARLPGSVDTHRGRRRGAVGGRARTCSVVHGDLREVAFNTSTARSLLPDRALKRALRPAAGVDVSWRSCAAKPRPPPAAAADRPSIWRRDRESTLTVRGRAESRLTFSNRAPRRVTPGEPGASAPRGAHGAQLNSTTSSALRSSPATVQAATRTSSPTPCACWRWPSASARRRHLRLRSLRPRADCADRVPTENGLDAPGNLVDGRRLGSRRCRPAARPAGRPAAASLLWVLQDRRQEHYTLRGRYFRARRRDADRRFPRPQGRNRLGDRYYGMASSAYGERIASMPENAHFGAFVDTVWPPHHAALDAPTARPRIVRSALPPTGERRGRRLRGARLLQRITTLTERTFGYQLRTQHDLPPVETERPSAGRDPLLLQPGTRGASALSIHTAAVVSQPRSAGSPCRRPGGGRSGRRNG